MAAIFTRSIQGMTVSLTVFLVGIVQQTVGSQVALKQVKVGILAVTSLGHCPGVKNAVLVFNIKMLSLELVKSWKSEKSVNSQLDYLFSFKMEHSIWGERPVQCPVFRAYWNLFSFLKAQGKILFHLQSRPLRDTKMIR